MKTKKLNLNDLKVDSFVTSLADKKDETLKGGKIVVVNQGCSPWLSLDTYQRCTDLTIPLTTKV